MNYFTDGAGRYVESSTPGPIVGFTEMSQEDYDAALLAEQEANDAAAEAEMAVVSTDRHDKAQGIYDEIHGIHPLTALYLAQQIDPTFTP